MSQKSEPKRDARALKIRREFFTAKYDRAVRLWYGRCRECAVVVCADYEADVPDYCDECSA